MNEREQFEQMFEAYRDAHRPNASRRASIEAAVFAGALPDALSEADVPEPDVLDGSAHVETLETAARGPFVARWSAAFAMGGVAAAALLAGILSATPVKTIPHARESQGVEALDAARDESSTERAAVRDRTSDQPRTSDTQSVDTQSTSDTPLVDTPPEAPPNEQTWVGPLEQPKPEPSNTTRPARPGRPTRPVRPAKESAKPTSAAQATAASTLDELRLLREAERVLVSRPQRSLTLLREHAQRFPNSKLTLERRALRVVALCRAGQTEQGVRERDAFSSKHRSSAYARRVENACRNRD